MAPLNGFYNEDVLEELLYDGKITQLEAIYHHSQERIDDFKSYCQRRKIQEDEDAAKAYADYRLKRIEHAHTDMLD